MSAELRVRIANLSDAAHELAVTVDDLPAAAGAGAGAPMAAVGSPGALAAASSALSCSGGIGAPLFLAAGPRAEIVRIGARTSVEVRLTRDRPAAAAAYSDRVPRRPHTVLFDARCQRHFPRAALRCFYSCLSGLNSCIYTLIWTHRHARKSDLEHIRSSTASSIKCAPNRERNSDFDVGRGADD